MRFAGSFFTAVFKRTLITTLSVCSVVGTHGSCIQSPYVSEVNMRTY